METKNLAAAIHELKQRRVIHGIPGKLLCARSSLDRGRLSELERGYSLPSEEEMERLEHALDVLVATKEKVERFASEVGWPTVIPKV